MSATAKTNRVSSLWDLPSTSAYLRSHDAKPRSLYAAVVSDDSGKYPKDVAVIKFDKISGMVQTMPEFMPSEIQQAAIKAEFEQAEWPAPIVTFKVAPDYPPEIKDVPKDHIYEMWDDLGHFVMLHVRREGKSGKYYQPWTYFDDSRWRMMEPDIRLPLFGIFRNEKGKQVNQLQKHNRVFIHEGPKGALKMQRLLDPSKLYGDPTFDDHPWGEFLDNAAHVAYIGGANAVHRTDFSSIRKAGIKEAIIVADNDEPGRASVSKIARELHCKTRVIEFNDLFPAGFDLGDDFPASMFGEIDGKKWYTGPSFHSLLHEATFATTRRKFGPNKSDVEITIRPHFLECYYYIADLSLYVDVANPTRRYDENSFNNFLSPFADVTNLSKLFNQSRNSVTYKICYNPADPRRKIPDGETASVNVYVPPQVKPASGDILPFKEYMEYMFPDPSERHTMYRWCYTLIARPDIRMEWAVLMTSTKQGVGKSTLGTQILMPLVGESNSSTPGEGDIVDSQFNDWAANKRLAVVNEIYSGQSWKAYNKLKSLITDPTITINIKFMRAHKTANWVHIYACSNSVRALKLEQTDRRWFVPTLTEVKWPKEKFDRFYAWLKSGGLSIIKYAAMNWPASDYVRPGEAAPETVRKEEMAYDSLSPAMQDVFDLVAMMNKSPDPIMITVRSIEAWVKRDRDVRVFESGLELRKAATLAGLVYFNGRHTINSRSETLLLNLAAQDHVAAMQADKVDNGAIVSWLRTVKKHINDIMLM
ncbi:hypothetical protein MCEMSEM23_01099 [Rhabdaerophilaceae bacterium]